MANQPVSSENPQTPGLTLDGYLAKTKGYQSMLVVGGETTPGKGFDLTGRVAGIGVPEAADVDRLAASGEPQVAWREASRAP